MIRGVKDYYGNKINPKTCIQATKVGEDSTTTIDQIWNTLVRDLEIELGTSAWQTSIGNYRYFKEFLVPDIREIDNPMYTLRTYFDVPTIQEVTTFRAIKMIETMDGAIRVYTNEIPPVSIRITLKNIPNRSFTVG